MCVTLNRSRKLGRASSSFEVSAIHAQGDQERKRCGEGDSDWLVKSVLGEIDRSPRQVTDSW